MKTLNVTYNNNGPFTAIPLERVGLGLHMYNSTEGYIHLCISEKLRHTDDYWLKTIKPGDRLKFSYSQAPENTESTISAIENYARIGETYSVPSGLRIGFDLIIAEKPKVRLSHSDNGGFSFMIGTVPADHARCFCMAGNEVDKWNWQLVDLYDGDEIELAIVETDWNTPFPRIERKDQEG
jgi:hypothetical protein